MASNFVAKFDPELSKNEFWRKKVYKTMAVRDTDRDGFITRYDFRLIIQRYREMGSPEKPLQELSDTYAKCFDDWGLVSDDVALSYDEFMKAFLAAFQKNHGLASNFIPLMFKIIDTDKDGMISFGEWENYYKANGIDLAYAQPSFEAMDTNKDGKASEDEFLAYLKEYFFSAEDNLKSSIHFGPLED